MITNSTRNGAVSTLTTRRSRLGMCPSLERIVPGGRGECGRPSCFIFCDSCIFGSSDCGVESELASKASHQHHRGVPVDPCVTLVIKHISTSVGLVQSKGVREANKKLTLAFCEANYERPRAGSTNLRAFFLFYSLSKLNETNHRDQPQGDYDPLLFLMGISDIFGLIAVRWAFAISEVR